MGDLRLGCKHSILARCLHMSEDKDPNKVAAALARKNALTPEQRKEIAAKAAAARWGHSAIHRGNFLKEFGIDIDCYVLNDPQKTAVISQRGMGQAIGFSRRGSRLGVFAASKQMEPYIGRELREKIENPIVFQRADAAASSVASKANGYDATILIDLCNAILQAKADGKLSGPRYANMIEQARIITGASAKSGIKGLVYALAGYSPTADEVVTAFKFYVAEEARKYEPEFPDDLYVEWHRLYDLEVPEKGRPWYFKYLTVNHVYTPLANSSGHILSLTRAKKADGKDRSKKLHQFLSDVGVKALRRHLGQLLGIAQVSDDKDQYEKNVRKVFGQQREFDF